MGVNSQRKRKMKVTKTPATRKVKGNELSVFHRLGGKSFDRISYSCVNETLEPLYCGHLGDLVACTVYSGTPLLWTPWGPDKVSCIQWNPSIVDTLGTWLHVQCTVEPLYCGHLGDLVACTVYSGTPLLWTPWGPRCMYSVQWNPSIVNSLGTWLHVQCTV